MTHVFLMLAEAIILSIITFVSFILGALYLYAYKEMKPSKIILGLSFVFFAFFLKSLSSITLLFLITSDGHEYALHISATVNFLLILALINFLYHSVKTDAKKGKVFI